MSSNPVEPQNLKVGSPSSVNPLQQNPQVQLQDSEGSKRSGAVRNVSSRYELRTPKTPQFGYYVSGKRKIDCAVPKSSDKWRKSGNPCDPVLVSDISGRGRKKLKGVDPCDQTLTSDVSLKRAELEAGGSCDRTPALDVSGGERKRLKGGFPRHQALTLHVFDDYCEVRTKETDFSRVINRSIEVYWPLEKGWYSGRIKRYDVYNKLHHVVYDDGEEEWVSLEREKYRVQVVPGDFLVLSRNFTKEYIHGNAEGSAIEHGKHGVSDNVQKAAISGGGNNIVQKTGIDGLQVGNRSRKRLKKNSKQVRVAGVDFQKEHKSRVKNYDHTNKLHLVVHEDGEEEWVSLVRENFRPLEAPGEFSGLPSSRTKSNGCKHTEDRATKQSKHGGADIAQKTGIGGVTGIVQKSGNDCSQEDYRRSKRVKRDSKQVNNAGIDDFQKNYDGGACVDQSKVEKNSFIHAFYDSDIHSGAQNHSVSTSKAHVITYSRKRRHSYSLGKPGRGENEVFISGRREGNAKGKNVAHDIGDSVALDNVAAVQKEPVNAYFRKRKKNALRKVDIIGSKKIQYFKMPFRFSPETLIVSGALKIHMSPLNLRKPSYWPCVAPGLQLCNVGSLELVKSHSLEDLMIFLQTLWEICYAGAQESRSSPSEFQQFEAGTKNLSKSRNMPLWECFKLLAMSDIQLQVLAVDTMSNVRRFYICGSFREVLSSLAVSLSSATTSAEWRVPVICSAAPSRGNLHAAVQSINIQFSISQGGLQSSFYRTVENICWIPTTNQSEWCGGSSDIQGGTLLVPDQSVFKYEQDADIMIGLQESTEIQRLLSHRQHSYRVSLHHGKNIFGSFQTMPFFQMSFTSAPSFFACLHTRLLFGKGTCLDCSQSHGLESSNVDNDLDSSCAWEGICQHNEPNLPGPLPSAEDAATLSRPRKTKIRLIPNLIQRYFEKCVQLEDNKSPIEDDWRVQSSTPSSGFDFNGMGCSSDMQFKKDNLSPVRPVLTLRRTSPSHSLWCLGRVSNPSCVKRGTSRVINQSFCNPVSLRVTGTNGQMESSQSAGCRSTSENADDVVLRPAGSGRRGRPRRQRRQDRFNQTGVDILRLASEELDSISCSANILVDGGDKCWREAGAEVRLESRSPNEWVLNIKIHGSTKYTYKSQEPKIPKAQEQKLCKTTEQVPSKRNCYTMIWMGGQNWSLEFRERIQWCLFGRMYEECYNRNLRAPPKDIPLPGVHLLNDVDSTTVNNPFLHPAYYIKIAENEVERALFRRNVYDMDSDDEEWLSDFNRNAVHDGGSGFEEVSEDTFEIVISLLEKASFEQPDSLNIGDSLTVAGAVQVCYDVVSVEVLASIHSHWVEKRKKKETALVRQFQTNASKESHPQTRRRGKVIRGKSFTGRHNVRPIGQHQRRDQEIEKHRELQQQQWEVNKIRFGNVFLPRALDHVSDEEARVQAAIAAASNKREIAAAKRVRAQRLMQKADLAASKAVKAVRIAETQEAIEEARLSNFSGKVFSPNFSTDSRANENGPTREGSWGIDNIWALTTYGHW